MARDTWTSCVKMSIVTHVNCSVAQTASTKVYESAFRTEHKLALSTLQLSEAEADLTEKSEMIC